MKGILFKPEMIVATVEGRKTNTRRAEAGLKEINKDPDAWKCQMLPSGILACRKKILYEGGFYFSDWVHIKPRYQVGETVYIKEAFMIEQSDGFDEPLDRPFKNDFEWGLLIPHYKLTDPDPELYDDEDRRMKWHSPLFMPEWAARYFIKILGNSAELLRLPLSPKEMELEGGEAALLLLEKINGLWVFRYEFEYLRQERR